MDYKTHLKTIPLYMLLLGVFTLVDTWMLWLTLAFMIIVMYKLIEM